MTFEYLNKPKKKPKEKPKKIEKEIDEPENNRQEKPKTKNGNGKVKVEKVEKYKVTLEDIGYELLDIRKDIKNLIWITMIIIFCVVLTLWIGYLSFTKAGWLKII